jgi:hypothetical protein
VPPAALDDDETDAAEHGDDVGPGRALDEPEGQAADGQDARHLPRQVKADPLPRGRGGNVPQCQHDRGDADGHVEEEDHRPAGPPGEHTAQHRPETGGDTARTAP